MSPMLQQHCGSLLRTLSGDRAFLRRLPRDLGSTQVYVSPRTDIRLLYWNLTPAAGDLFTVARHFVREGDTVWDIGANLGLFSFSAAAKAGSKGRVLSIEPDARHVELLLKSRKRLPKTSAPVDILSCAVSHQSGIATLAISSRGHARNHLAEVAGNDAGETVERKSVITVTLDWLLDHHPAPNFIKIDVEGAELLALQGAKKLLSEVRPTIYIEVANENLDEATRLLTSYNYDLFDPLTDPTGRPHPIDRCIFNTLAIPR
jgi:FkbM family methyltransferase